MKYSNKTNKWANGVPYFVDAADQLNETLNETGHHFTPATTANISEPLIDSVTSRPEHTAASGDTI